MKVCDLLVNRLRNPLGFDLETPSFSYVVKETEAKKQVSARIFVSEEETFSHLVYDSGECAEIDPLDFEVPVSWKPCTRYFWKVWVRADNGDEAISEAAWFETPKDAHWTGKWISPKADPDMHYSIYRDFVVSKPVKKARLYGVGLGVYELYLNGEKQGNEFLLPGLHAYDSWIQYQTYDLALQQGENHIEFLLGNGWYKGLYGLALEENNYGDRLACIGEIAIWYEDGGFEVIGTDTCWKARRNPIVSSSIYDGECYDATMDMDEPWDTEEIDLGDSRLRPRLSPPITAQELLKPTVIHTPAEEIVLDMHQNMVGWISFRNNQPRGNKVRFQFGEILQNGNFYRDNLRSAKAEFTYISDGVPTEVRPHFTFYGFRYVKISGWIGEINPDDFTGVVISSQLTETGFLETSDPLVNQLIHNAKWGQKGNFLDVPTDCPQRDERMGWTGDAQIFSGTACYNADAYAFFTKYCHDLFCEQQKFHGSVPHVVPATHYTHHASAAWGDAATVIPWTLYLHYGKKGILRRQYASMKAWVDYIKQQDDSSGATRLWKNGNHFGDWVALDGPVKGGVFGGTDPHFIASVYYYYSTDLVRKAAEVLGYSADAQKYRTLAEEIKHAIEENYITPAGNLTVNTMTGHVLALFFGLAPKSAEPTLCQGLLDLLKKSKYHLTTGFVGTPYLCRVLSNFGMNDIAYHLLMEKGYPGWLYEVLLGATTIWERWDSVLPDGSISGIEMNSLNHYAYGSILEWMYRDMVGISPSEESPGFRKVVISPKPNYRISWINCTLHTASGCYHIEWEVKPEQITLRLQIPFHTQAKVILPDANSHAVHCSKAVQLVQTGSNTEMELDAGSYEFQYRPTTPYRKKYSIYSTLQEVLENEEATKILAEQLSEEGILPPSELSQESLDNQDQIAAQKIRNSLPFAQEIPILIDLLNSPFVEIPQDKQKLIDQKLRQL